MTQENERVRQPTPQDSAMMLAAEGILAYAASMMTHEALGHGGYCLTSGGHTVMLTAWSETCKFPSVAEAGIKAAGPGVQFGAGLLAWLVLHLLSKGAPRLRYFLWLYMTFDLLISSGYVAFSGVTNFGDAAELIAVYQPRIVWRGGLVLFGSVAYFLSMQAAALELKRFAGVDEERKRLYRLVWIPYASAGVFACCTAALNHTMGHGAAIGLAAVSSFGGGLGMLYLPEAQRGMVVKQPPRTVYLGWNFAWGVAAALVIVFFLFFIGPGLSAQSFTAPVSTYKVIGKYPHSTASYTEGFFYLNGLFYESTGLVGRSAVMAIQPDTGKPVQQFNLAPDLFGEGIVDWGPNILGWTWQTHMGFVYDRFSFRIVRQFRYEGEGWGMTRTAKEIITSDGTATLRFRNPETFKETHHIVVKDGKTLISKLNELEFVKSEIYANVWHTDQIARISPVDGHVIGWIDLTGLLPDDQRVNAEAVLNGIAYDAKSHRLFVTGKQWPAVFEIKVVTRSK